MESAAIPYASQLGMGGIIALLLLREVFGFMKSKKSGEAEISNGKCSVLTHYKLDGMADNQKDMIKSMRHISDNQKDIVVVLERLHEKMKG